MDENSELYKDLDRVLLKRDEISVKVRELGQQITRDYAGKKPVMVCILKGAAVFFTDLAHPCADDGLSPAFILGNIVILQQRGAKSLKIATLLDKPARRKVQDLKVDYMCFDIPDAFVVGYGLDYDQRYRNLPDIGILSPKIYGNQ